MLNAAKTTVMAHYVAQQSQVDQRSMGETLIEELDRLFKLGWSVESVDIHNYVAFVSDLSQQMTDAITDDRYPYGRDDTCQLIALLASQRQDPVVSLINDLAEILFLKRRQRTEYVGTGDGPQPFVISKLMLEYAVKSRRLDDIVSGLTKRFCAENCDKLPNGCCYILGYDMGLVPKTMLRLQALEAGRNGHLVPPIEDKCKYHTHTGCTIALFKSPACIGYLCDPLMESMKAKYPAVELSRFLDCLALFRNGYIDRRNIFEAMDSVIAAGNALLVSRGSDRV